MRINDAYLTRNGRGSPPNSRTGVVIRRGPDGAASRLGATTSTVGTAAMASPSRSSLPGRLARASATSGESPGTISARRGGEKRSGSANRISMPRTLGPPAAMRCTSSATSVRGQGHCPFAARLASSMATITTPLSASARGHSRCAASKPLSRHTSTKLGSMTRINTATASTRNPGAHAGTCQRNRTPAIGSSDRQLKPIVGGNHLHGVTVPTYFFEAPGLLEHAFDHAVVEYRFMMKQDQPLHLRQLRQLDRDDVA